MKHNRVVSFIKTPVFMLKEAWHRRPDPGFDWHFLAPEQAPRAAGCVQVLKRDGILLLPGYFTGESLSAMRQAFEEVVRNRPSQGNPGAFGNTDFLHSDAVFLHAALDDLLLEIVARYYGRKFAIGRASALRILPIAPDRYGSFMWHHDARGRQIHLMILLTEVPAHGQRMSYLRQSHARYYGHYRGVGAGSRFEREVVESPEAKGRITDVIGPSGTVAIFDSNGLHTGNRNESARRDTLTICYVTKRHFKKLQFRQRDVTALPRTKQQVVTFNPYCELIA